MSGRYHLGLKARHGAATLTDSRVGGEARK
jgi:hypothetical protein